MANQTEQVNVEEWSNSLSYLRRISYLEDRYIESSTQEDVQSMILHLRNLVSVLKPMRKSRKNKADDVFNKESSSYWGARLSKARELYAKSRESDRGNRATRHFQHKQRNESLETLRELYEDLADFQMKNNLTFKESIDPNEAWALG